MLHQSNKSNNNNDENLEQPFVKTQFKWHGYLGVSDIRPNHVHDGMECNITSYYVVWDQLVLSLHGIVDEDATGVQYRELSKTTLYDSRVKELINAINKLEECINILNQMDEIP